MYTDLLTRSSASFSTSKWISYIPIVSSLASFKFYLAKVEANLTRKALYITAFTLLLISSIILMFGLKMPLLIAATVILAGLSFGFVYTKDSVIVQEETNPRHMKKMMSFYALTKNLGSSIGSTVMGYFYAMSIGFINGHFYNILLAAALVSILLIIMWSTLYKSEA
ncbi:MFS transporter [Staphylococcus borealis]|nr:MFS transporter [Staphylococcus borealis]MEB7365980.1 MFS transporter [Staphylococcus borealis]MEB7458594.1 MFS transporter [Staphylococcus borealis]